MYPCSTRITPALGREHLDEVILAVGMGMAGVLAHKDVNFG